MVADAAYSLGTCFGPLRIMAVCSCTIILNFDQFCPLVFSVDSRFISNNNRSENLENSLLSMVENVEPPLLIEKSLIPTFQAGVR